MKKLSTFILGFLIATLLYGTIIPVLAQISGINFNQVNLEVKGKKIASIDEMITLSNGEKVPYSITYTDKLGGDTTYLPIRKISESLGEQINYNDKTNTVLIGGDVIMNDNTNSETLSYEEFKNLWNYKKRQEFSQCEVYSLTLKEISTYNSLIIFKNNNEKLFEQYCYNFAKEIYNNEYLMIIYCYGKMSDNNTICTFGFSMEKEKLVYFFN